jgi:hypothetical protein
MNRMDYKLKRYVELTAEEQAKWDLLGMQPDVGLVWSDVTPGKMYFWSNDGFGAALCSRRGDKPGCVIYAETVDEALRLYTTRPAMSIWQ